MDAYRTPSNMRVQELREFAIAHKLSPTGTGKDGLVIKPDLIKVYQEYWDKKWKERSDEAKKQGAELRQTLNSFEFKKSMYTQAWTSVEYELLSLIKHWEINPVRTLEETKYILNECLFIKTYRGSSYFDSYIQELTNELNEHIL